MTCTVLDGTQKQATSDLRGLERAVRTAVADLRAAAKERFNPASQFPAAWSALTLAEPIPERTDAFLGRAYALFDNTLEDPALIDALARFGYTKKKLEADRKKVEAMDLANRSQEQAKGSRKGAVSQKDADLSAMRDWMRAFKKMTRRALKERADLMTKLGL